MKNLYKKILSLFLVLMVFSASFINASSIDDIPDSFRFSDHGTISWKNKNDHESIKYLQILLNHYEKIDVNLHEDGIFGNNTYNAIKAFQKSQGLSGKDVDGIVGSNTKKLLDKVLSELKSSNNNSSSNFSVSKVSLHSPGNTNYSGLEISNKQPILKWNSDPYATYYFIELKDINSGSLILNNKKITVNSSYMYSSYQLKSDLILGHKYRWRVKSCNSSGCSNWSDSFYFKIKTNDNTEENWKNIKPIPISPGGKNGKYTEISTTQPTFRWKTIKGVPRYEVTIKYANNIPVVLNSYSLDKDNSYTIPAGKLKKGSKYYWYVETYDNNGHMMKRSDKMYFKISDDSRINEAKIIPDSHCGVTIITHGYMSNANGWVLEMAKAIRKRMGYTEKELPIQKIILKGRVFTETRITNGKIELYNGNAIIIVDWSDIADGTSIPIDIKPTVPTDIIAKRIYNVLPKEIFQMPIHLIGHSRGGSVMSALSYYLGENGKWVKHLTFLDPHPFGGINKDFDYNDNHKMHVWDNIIFADDYYNQYFSRLEFVTGRPTYKGYSYQEDLFHLGKGRLDFDFKVHQRVHAYYHGTIDLDAYSDNDDTTIDNAWYSAITKRNNIGYNLSLVAFENKNKSPFSNDKYLTGLHSGVKSYLYTGGSTNNRNYITPLSKQTVPNIGLYNLKDNDIKVNQTVEFSYYYQDKDRGNLKVELYLDNDRNPYNGQVYSKPIASKTIYPNSSRIGHDTLFWTPSENMLGKYYVMAKITDISHTPQQTAYAYMTTSIHIWKEKHISNQIVNKAPNTPALTIQKNTIINNHPFVSTITSPFSDPNPKDTHWKTWWGVMKNGHYIWTSSWSTVNKTTIDIPIKLDFNTKYTIHVRHMDNHGQWSSGYGRITFTTKPAPKPKVTTLPTSSITTTSATIASIVEHYDEPNTKAYFKWGKSQNLGDSTSTNKQLVDNNNHVIAIKLENLECDTTYYVQAIASNSKGKSEGEIKSFTTQECIKAEVEISSMIDFLEVEVGSCKTMETVVTKKNSEGIAHVSFDVTGSAFELVSSQDISLENKNDKAKIKVKFCPTNSKNYYGNIKFISSDTIFNQNSKTISLYGKGKERVKDDFYLENPNIPTSIKEGEILSASVALKYHSLNSNDKKVYIGYYLSRDETLGNDRNLGKDYVYVRKNKDEFISSKGLQIPYGEIGQYYIIFVADPEKQYDTDNRNDNIVAVPITIEPKQIPINHDFSISNFQLKSTKTQFTKNETVDITAQFEYSGNSTKSLKLSISIYLSKDKTIDSLDKKLLTVSNLTFSQSDVSNSIDKSITIPSDTDIGNQYLIIKIDDTDKYQESNKNNNIKTIPINIITPQIDTDKDGIADSEDTDDDNDGISDIDEIKYGLNPLDPNDAELDNDNDGVSNINEIKAGSNPLQDESVTDISIAPIKDMLVKVNTKIEPVEVIVTGAKDSVINYKVSSDTPDLVTVTMKDNKIFFHPVADKYGIADIKVTASVDELNTSRTFELLILDTIIMAETQNSDGDYDWQDKLDSFTVNYSSFGHLKVSKDENSALRYEIAQDNKMTMIKLYLLGSVASIDKDQNGEILIPIDLKMDKDAEYILEVNSDGTIEPELKDAILPKVLPLGTQVEGDRKSITFTITLDDDYDKLEF